MESARLDIDLKALVAWSDWAALRNRRGEEAAPHLKKIAAKHGVDVARVEARFWVLVGFFGRTCRVGWEPTVDANGSLRKGKHGSRRLMTEARGCHA